MRQKGRKKVAQLTTHPWPPVAGLGLEEEGGICMLVWAPAAVDTRRDTGGDPRGLGVGEPPLEHR